MRENIIQSISARLLSTQDGRNKTNWLWQHIQESEKTIDEFAEEIYSLIIGKVAIAVLKGAPFVGTAISIGQAIRLDFGIESVEEETKMCLHCGSKILEAFCNIDYPSRGVQLFDINKVNPRTAYKNNALYVLECKDHELLDEIINGEDIEQSPEFPLLEPASDWTSGYNPSIKAQLIRGASSSTLKKCTPNSAPRVYKALNKLQKTEFVINPDVFKVYKTLMSQQDKKTIMRKEYTISDLSPFKHEKEEILGSRAGMFLEAKFILALASNIGERPFYQAYNTDFRGRIYPLTPYLHEQSSDNAKGLLTYGKGVPLGEQGIYWLGVHLANSIGEDKLKLDERAQYVEDRMDEIIAWAEDPLVNTGWMEADKPWSSLACAFELKKIQEFVLIGGNDVADYVCHVPIFIDGSNNGVQHLTALSLDEKIAPLVNLVPTEVPGDVYMYVADKTWEALDVLYEEMGDNPVKKELPRLLEEIKGHKMKREVAKNKAEADEAFAGLDAWRKENAELLSDIHVPFWRIFKEDKKLQRKTVKRPVMTLGYGVTKRGVQDQVFEDTKGLSEELKFKDKPNWTTPFADLLRDTMLEKLKGPATMLELFRNLAEKANIENRYLAWNVPLTNFSAVQEYNRLKKVEVRVQFCNKKKKGLQLVIQPEESGKLNKSKQLTGAAPNIIHSFDAAHLTLIVNESPFIVTTVHDSFGCHPGNMEDLFRVTREEFVRFYESDPLAQLLAQTDCLELYPERGSLTLTDVMDSDFAFC